MQSQSKTILPTFSPVTKLIGSGILAFVILLNAAVYPPMLVLAGLFAFQTLVKYLAYDGPDTRVSFTERLFMGCAQMIAAVLMIGSGIPDNQSGLLWVGCSLLVLSVGLRNLYRVSRVTPEYGMSKVQTVTVKQRTKESKAEEHLLADLSEFLGDSDSAGEGNRAA